MKTFYIMSDIHGCYDEMKIALESWDPKKEHLVILGDLIDRGPKSYEVVRHLMKLQDKSPGNVTVLMGNHEEMLLSWLLDTHDDLLNLFYNKIHNATMKSFLGKDDFNYLPSFIAKELRVNFKAEIDWMSNLPLYLESDNIIFVHAGVNPDSADWRKDKQFILWARQEFFYSKKVLDKKVYFGHTPTRMLHTDMTDRVWKSKSGDKICIDGGVSMDGQINALKISSNGEIIKEIVVKNQQK